MSPEGEGGADGGKLSWLERSSLSSVANPVMPIPPIFSLTPMLTTFEGVNPLQAEFYQLPSIAKLMELHGAGIVTANDDLCVQFSAAETLSVTEEFIEIDLAPLIS